MSRQALAVDIGGSKLQVGIVDETGFVLHSTIAKWNILTEEGVVQEIIATINEVLDHNEYAKPSFIGVNIPGLADPLQGLWVEASFSGIRNLDIGNRISDTFSLPCYVENDANACTLAEKLFGSCADIDDFLYLTISNGVGGGAFSGGRLLYGSAGNAIEIGHVVVEPNGRPCGCGHAGCLEKHAAGPGILHSWLEQGGDSQIEGHPAEAKFIAKLAREGEPLAKKVFRDAGTYLGMVLAMSCNILNPQKVVIGGGISLAFDLLQNSLLTALLKGIYRNANPSLVIEPTRLGYDGGLLGAAAIAFTRQDNLFDIQSDITRVYRRKR